MSKHETGSCTLSHNINGTIFDFVDEMLLLGYFDVVDAICRSWPVDNDLPGNLEYCLALLTVTQSASQKLPSRAALLWRCKNEYRAYDKSTWEGL